MAGTPGGTVMTHAAGQHREWLAYGIYTAVALIVMLPLFRPGFILTLDMAFTPHLRMPDSITSSYVLHAALFLLTHILPAAVVTKLLLLAALLLAAFGMHRLIRCYIAPRTGPDWGAYIASVFFAMNPFTYSRFMAGQYSVLLGYALLPWFARQLVMFGREPYLVNALKLGTLTAVIGIVSIHTLGEVAIMGAVAATIGAWHYRSTMYAYIRYGLAALGVCALLSSYWLIPLATGQGKTAATIQSFTAADSQAFATTGGSVLGRVGNVLRLQGFWAEGRGLYLLPQDRTVLWGLMMFIILALVAAGGVLLWYKRPTGALLFGASALISILLAVGFMSPVLGALGYREPQKFIGLLALTYALYMAFGIRALLGRLQARGITAYTAGLAILCALPLMISRVMLWGFDGQLVPRQYPASWTAVNARLNQDHGGGDVLALPWHQYMSYRFAGRIIANPSAAFFDRHTITGQDPELGGASGGKQDSTHQAINQALQQDMRSEEFSRQLADLHIKYVLLAKEMDYRRYDHIMQSGAFRPAADYPDITLYQNTAWRDN
jgi:hypothetical protein